MTPVTPALVSPAPAFSGRGCHVRVISPGVPVMAYAGERCRRATESLESLGLEVSFGQHAFAVSADGMTAGTTEQRAADLMAAFQDSTVDLVITSEAGYGTRDLIPLLDPAPIRANSKPFIGTCDNAFISAFLLSQAGLTSFYGYTFLLDFGEAGEPFPETVDCFQRALFGQYPLRLQPIPEKTGEFWNWLIPELDTRVRQRARTQQIRVLNPGHAAGRLIGGELSTLPDLLADGLLESGDILFWEISAGNDESHAGQFASLSRVAALKDLAGMIVGAHPRMADGQWADWVTRTIRKHVPVADYPILINADITHLRPSWLVPYGEQAEIGPDGAVCIRHRPARPWEPSPMTPGR